MLDKAFYDAFHYVNGKYVFNTENYPVIANFSSEKDKEVFAIKHVMLHFQKNISHVLHNENRKVIEKEPILKMLVNLMKISDLAEIEINRSGFTSASRIDKTDSTFGQTALMYIGLIATELEKFDHRKNPDDVGMYYDMEYQIQRYVEGWWRKIFFGFDVEFKNHFTLIEALGKISGVMESK
jgi:hypothetical protein